MVTFLWPFFKRFLKVQSHGKYKRKQRKIDSSEIKRSIAIYWDKSIILRNYIFRFPPTNPAATI